MNAPSPALDGNRSAAAEALAARKHGPSALPVGAMIAGKYRLVRYLARGGMAEVWLATHEALRSDVAIKFVSLGLARDQNMAPFALERFRFEAQISAKLSALTRNVVLVHDAGLHEEIPYLVMEYVAGPTLDEEVARKGALEPALVADILDQAAEALEAAHSIGVIHRDLKPSNLMLLTRPDGGVLVKVADFGVAKATDKNLAVDRPRETVDGEIVGSPSFMSPEQIRGTAPLDARSDIWSLGVVAYEILTGAPCFEGDTVSDCLVSVLSRPVVPPSRARPGLSKAFDAWFNRALSKDPDGRFDSAREAAAAFRSALARAPRRRWMGALAMGGAALLVAGIGVVAVVAGGARKPEAPPHVATSAPTATAVTEAPPAPSSAPSAAADATAKPAVAHPTKPASATTPRPVKDTHPTATAAPTPPPPPPVVETVAPAPPPAPPPTSKRKIDPSEVQ